MICVHLFPAMMMTELRCSYGVRIPTYFVATDFTCSPGVGICRWTDCASPTGT